jgi:hypothetical protein
MFLQAVASKGAGQPLPLTAAFVLPAVGKVRIKAGQRGKGACALLVEAYR